jgi:hypothetical protein
MIGCYEISYIGCSLLGCLLFFLCMFAANNKNDCDMSSTMYGWLIYYGLYDMFFFVNLMVLFRTLKYTPEKLTSFFNFHTMTIIIPNTIIVIVMGLMGDLHTDSQDCNKTQFSVFCAHWITYSFLSFFICYIGFKIYLINKCTARIEVQTITEITVQNNITVCETNNISECIVCFEDKKMYSLKCKHTFCYDCIMKWNKGCMLCRDNNV